MLLKAPEVSLGYVVVHRHSHTLVTEYRKSIESVKLKFVTHPTLKFQIHPAKPV